jgi:hypothetical protein
MSLTDEQFDAAINSPWPWLRFAESLMQAARRLDWTKESLSEQTPGQFLIYRFLIGLAMENLLKGIVIAHGYQAYDGNKLESKFASHKLKNLARVLDATKLTLSSLELKVLDGLEPFIIWAGRYPISKTKADQCIRGHSSDEHESEIKLYERLRAHLADVGWYWDCDGNKIPFKAPSSDPTNCA